MPDQPDRSEPGGTRTRMWLHAFSPRNLVGSPRQRATSCVRSYSTSTPGVKEERIEVGHGLGRLAVDGEAVWVTSALSRAVSRIGRGSGQIDCIVPLGRRPIAIAAGAEAVWVLCANGWLWRLRPNGEGEGVARLGRRARGLACDAETVWVLHASGRLVGAEQWTGEVTAEAKIRRGGRQLLHGGGVLVALSGNGTRICRIAPGSGAVEAETKLPGRGVDATFHDGTLWVACGRRLASRWGALVPVDPGTLATGTMHVLPSSPRAIAADAAHLWVATGRRGERKSSVVRVDPDAGRVDPWGETDWTIYDLALAGDRLLAATGLRLAGPVPGMDGGMAGAGGGGDGGGGGGGS